MENTSGMMRFYALAETAFGWLVLAGQGATVSFVGLPKRTREEALQIARAHGEYEAESAFGDLPYRLRLYFVGEAVEFGDATDSSGATSFQLDVWNATRSIPFGQVRSYAWVAGRVGRPKACRAVGLALGCNPTPVIVPCHRVVTSSGCLGGFTGGIELKKALLRLEGVDLRASSGTSSP